MKTLIASLSVCVLACSLATAGEPSASDQKWLQTVEGMVQKGARKISTPSETRVKLFKEWAAKEGYTVKVSKTETGYGLELSGEKAKGIAQK